MKNFRYFIFLLLAFVLSPAVKSQNPDYKRTIIIDGTGEIRIKPDVANISFMLSESDPDFNKAVNKLNTKVNDLKKSLKKAGIDKSGIYSSNYSIKREYHYDRNKGEKIFTGYRVSHNIFIETEADTKAVNDVFSAVISSLDNIELILSFGIKNPEKLENKIMELAVEDAKNKAVILAENSGVDLGQIVKIVYTKDTPSVRSNQNTIELTKKMADSSQIMIDDFNPQEIKQSTQVKIIWEIK